MGEARLLANRYRLDTVVGRGGMGTVWRAYDVTLDRQVAVKEVVLPPGLSGSERGVLYERTFREARASARLSHPGVVIVHDVVEESGRPWIVMELVMAPSLQDILDEGPMEHRRVAQIGLQMLAALRHAHEKGILHRDVKPSNVLITDAGRVVLTDFGIAQVEGDATLTQTGLVMGSPAYIPPERAAGERAVPASDLWALGATMYAAVEGHSPYERPDAMASLQAALTEPVPPPRNAGPLARVLDGLLAREPVHRMNATQAQPLLAQVASMPSPPSASETMLDETMLDGPSGRGPSGRLHPGARDAPAETVLDSDELEAITRHDPPGGENYSGQNYRHENRRTENQGERYRGDDHRDERYSGSGRPSVDPEARTLLGTEWATQSPPPSRSDPSYQQGPQTPPPWEQPHQYARWQQPPPHHDVDPRERERHKTNVIVAVAAILVVAAVLIGAFILRNTM